MATITLEEMQRDLEGCLQRVEAGETLLIVRGNGPIAEVKPVEQPSRKPRPAGLAEGQFSVPDSFFEPLPDELLDLFEGR
jgi:antitoxin (DNA-binding transcriptional repressor) of toxin-antitoxin stability system